MRDPNWNDPTLNLYRRLVFTITVPSKMDLDTMKSTSLLYYCTLVASKGDKEKKRKEINVHLLRVSYNFGFIFSYHHAMDYHNNVGMWENFENLLYNIVSPTKRCYDYE